MPASNTAAPTLLDMSPARRTPEAVQARIRITAPFDMSGHPALTLPGGTTGPPVTYMVKGKQFIVVAVGLKVVPGELVALALP